jgi:hypothetical protein
LLHSLFPNIAFADLVFNGGFETGDFTNSPRI